MTMSIRGCGLHVCEDCCIRYYERVTTVNLTTYYLTKRQRARGSTVPVDPNDACLVIFGRAPKIPKN